jgi:hypothetical protein
MDIWGWLKSTLEIGTDLFLPTQEEKCLTLVDPGMLEVQRIGENFLHAGTARYWIV